MQYCEVDAYILHPAQMLIYELAICRAIVAQQRHVRYAAKVRRIVPVSITVSRLIPSVVMDADDRSSAFRGRNSFHLLGSISGIFIFDDGQKFLCRAIPRVAL